MQITHSRLIEKLIAHRGNAFVGFVTFTIADLRKTGNDLGPILKRSELVAMVGASYGNAVNKEGEREGNADAGKFVPHPLKWGKFRDETDGKIIDHNGRVYVRMTFTPNMRPAIVSYHAPDGSEVSHETVAPFLPKKATSATQSEFGNVREIIVRTFAIDSIVSITFAGETLDVVKDSDYLDQLYSKLD